MKRISLAFIFAFIFIITIPTSFALAQSTTVWDYDTIAITQTSVCDVRAVGVCTGRRIGGISVGTNLYVPGGHEYAYAINLVVPPVGEIATVSSEARIIDLILAPGLHDIRGSAVGPLTSIDVDLHWACDPLVEPTSTPPAGPTPTPFPTCTQLPCGVASFFTLSDRAAWTRFLTDWSPYGAVISPGGWLRQDAVCLERGEYAVEICAKAVTNTEFIYSPFSIPDEPSTDAVIEFALDGERHASTVPLRAVTDSCVAQNIYFNATSSGEHVFRVAHTGLRHAIVLQSICFYRVGTPPRDDGLCGYIRNPAFQETAPGAADPWRMDWGFALRRPVFRDGVVTLLNKTGIAQSVLMTETIGTSRVFTFTLQASVAQLQPARPRARIVFEDGTIIARDFSIGASGWHTFTWVFSSSVGIVDVKVDNNAWEWEARNYRAGWVCLEDENHRAAPLPVRVDDGKCLICQQPVPTGCDTSLSSGTCEYYGNAFGTIAGLDDFFHLGEIVERLFRWLKCWLVCLFDEVVAAIRAAWHDATSEFSGFTCWGESIPRWIMNAGSQLLDEAGRGLALLENDWNTWVRGKEYAVAAYWAGVRYRWDTLKNTLHGLEAGARQILNLVLHVGDLYVAFINILFLLITMPLAALAMVAAVAVLLITAIAGGPREPLPLPATGTLWGDMFWCTLGLLEWTVVHTPLAMLPGWHAGEFILENMLWVIRKFSGQSDSDSE